MISTPSQRLELPDPAPAQAILPDSPGTKSVTDVPSTSPKPFIGLSGFDLQEALRRLELLEAYWASGSTLRVAATALKTSPAKLSRFSSLCAPLRAAGASRDELLQALAPQRWKCGRKIRYKLTDYELAKVREIYARLNASRVKGPNTGSSKVTAFRLVASSPDSQISEEFRGIVWRRTTRSLPPSWESLLETPASVLAHVRDNESTMGAYVSTPRGRTYIDAHGAEKPLRPGVLFESDDGTINFPVVVDWPYGGDRCSERFGVKIGRFQLLPVIDVDSHFCPMWHFVVRSKASYRGEDVLALFGDAFTNASVGMPEALRLERGAWESSIVKDAMRMSNVHVETAWTAGQKAAVEGFFDRVWTPLSLLPGDVGRFRGDNAENTELVLQCQEGRRDPRGHFLTVAEAAQAIGNAVAFANGELMETRWGKLIPQQRWEEHVTNAPLRLLPDLMRIFFSREQRIWTVRKCCVGGRVATPMTELPVYFQTPQLWEFEGCRVKAFFDPYEPDCKAALVLQDAWRGRKPGHVIARDVPALDLPPQAILAADWESTDEQRRQFAIRKAAASAVRTESWNWRGGRRTTIRDGAGNSVIVDGGATDRATALPAATMTPARAPDARARARARVSQEADDFSALDPGRTPRRRSNESSWTVSTEELEEL